MKMNVVMIIVGLWMAAAGPPEWKALPFEVERYVNVNAKTYQEAVREEHDALILTISLGERPTGDFVRVDAVEISPQGVIRVLYRVCVPEDLGLHDRYIEDNSYPCTQVTIKKVPHKSVQFVRLGRGQGHGNEIAIVGIGMGWDGYTISKEIGKPGLVVVRSQKALKEIFTWLVKGQKKEHRYSPQCAGLGQLPEIDFKEDMVIGVLFDESSDPQYLKAGVIHRVSKSSDGKSIVVEVIPQTQRARPRDINLPGQKIYNAYRYQFVSIPKSAAPVVLYDASKDLTPENRRSAEDASAKPKR